MYKTYRVKEGDTLERISRVLYGYEGKAGNLSILNGLNDPLEVGTLLKYTEEEKELLGVGQQVESTADIQEILITINDEPITNIESYELSLSLTGFRVLVLYTYWQENNKLPLIYKYGNEVKLYENGLLQFTGYIAQIPRRATPNERIMDVLCMSKASILGSTMPYSAFPLEYRNVSLRQLIQRCANIFGLDVELPQDRDLELDKIFKNDFNNGVSARLGESVIDFLVRICKTRGFIVADTPAGNIKIVNVEPRESDFELDQNRDITSIIDTRDFSLLGETYLVFSQYMTNNAVGQFRIKDFPLPITKTIITEENDDNDINDLAQWIACREVGKAMRIKIGMAKTTIAGKDLIVGAMFDLTAPALNIDRKQYIVERIIKEVGNQQKIRVIATTPKAYTGEAITVKDLSL